MPPASNTRLEIPGKIVDSSATQPYTSPEHILRGNGMRNLLYLAVAACVAGVGGCGAQGVLLGTEGSYVLTVMDALAVPGQPVELRARLEAGDLLKSQAGHVVRFARGGKLFKAAETDEEGAAAVAFTPDEPGDFTFVADVAPGGMPDAPPPPQELRVVCRSADAPMVVVDLDKTVVASGFHAVLIGSPKPMPGSAEVLRRLAETRTVVYLTHRPDYFGPKSKGWLRANRYPTGAVLMSTISGFLMGSGSYKTEMIRQMRERFRNIRTGIGDKISDALAYHDNGLQSFLIISIPDGDEAGVFEQLADDLKQLPPAVQVVTGWDQIAGVLFEGASYPRPAAEARLRELAAACRARSAAAEKNQPGPPPNAEGTVR